MWAHKPHTKKPYFQAVRFKDPGRGNINALNQNPNNAHDNNYGVRNDI